MYYEISESLAARAHAMVHMSDYLPGSCTAAYRRAVDAAVELVEAKKQRVSPFYHDALDGLLNSYARRLAVWQNDYNRNQAAYPSQFISGAGNFNTRKHNKQMAREKSLWAEYREIESILDKIKSVGTGPVDLQDPHAREILQDRLQKLTAALETDKAANAYYRKHKTLEGCPGISSSSAAELARPDKFPGGSFLDVCGKPFPDYELASLRDKIKRTAARLEELDKREAAKGAPAENLEFDGGEIIQNAALNRLQIIFDEIPSPDLRQRLKSGGFHWSPANKAWQRQLTSNALHDAKSILHIV